MAKKKSTISPFLPLISLRLEKQLRTQLIECGWRDELKLYCKELIRKKGLEKVTIEELVGELIAKGRSTVPVRIKDDLLQKIKKYFEEEGDL